MRVHPLIGDKAQYGNLMSIPFFLDDLGCTGSESNLLECLPLHNCRASLLEDAVVTCLNGGTVVSVLEMCHKFLLFF